MLGDYRGDTQKIRGDYRGNAPEDAGDYRGNTQKMRGAKEIPPKDAGLPQRKCPRRCWVTTEEIPQKMRGAKETPQKMLGAKETPQKTLGAKEIPQKMLGAEEIPQTMLGEYREEEEKTEDAW